MAIATSMTANMNCLNCKGENCCEPLHGSDSFPVTPQLCRGCRCFQFLCIEECKDTASVDCRRRHCHFGSYKQLRNHVGRHHKAHRSSILASLKLVMKQPPVVPLQAPMEPGSHSAGIIEDPMETDFGASFEEQIEHVDLAQRDTVDSYVAIEREKSDFELSLVGNNNNFQGAVVALIYRCCLGIERCSQPEVDMRTNHEISQIFVDIANQALTSRQDQLWRNCRLLSNLIPLKYRENHGNIIQVPSSLDSVKKLILSNRKLSWRSLLPSPSVEKLRNGHAYVTITSLLCHASMTSTKKDYGSLRQRHAILVTCPRFQKFKKTILERLQQSMASCSRRGVIVIFFVWSDGWDPNLSIKSNRGTVWALTITFLFFDMSKKIFYMIKNLVCAVGLDKTDHTHVFLRVKKEFKMFAKRPVSCPSHWHGTPGDVDFYLLPFGCLMDNPERRTNFWLRSCTSKNHLFFSMNSRLDLLDQPFDTLKCKDCSRATCEYISLGDFRSPIRLECTKCLSFQINRLDEIGTHKEPVAVTLDGLSPDVPGYHLIRKPGYLTCKLLKSGWTWAFSECISNTLTKKSAADYLRHVLCIHESAIKRFLIQVEEMRLYNQYLAGHFPAKPAEVANHLETNPAYYEEECGMTNPIWDCFELKHAFETIMHNCMNTGKALRDFIFSWASNLSLKTDLLKECDKTMTLVQKLCVDDFKARGVSTEMFGGFVGENYRAFVALCPWVFLCLKRRNFQKSAPGSPPSEGLSMDLWTVDNLKHFLYSKNVRQVEVKTVVKSEPKPIICKSINWLKYKRRFLLVAKQVLQFVRGNEEIEFTEIEMEDTDLEPDKKVFVRPYFSSQPVLQGEEVYKLLPLVSQCFSVLMDIQMEGEESANRAEAYVIRLLDMFLLLLSRVTEDPCTHLQQKACLFGLLRSAHHLRELPWLKCIHEGDDMGEGIVKHLRKLVPNGLRGSTWQVPLLTKFYKGDSMQFINSFYPEPESEQEGGEKLLGAPEPEEEQHISQPLHDTEYGSIEECFSNDSVIAIGCGEHD